MEFGSVGKVIIGKISEDQVFDQTHLFLIKGGCPYPDMEVLELIDRLESGYRMEKPHHIADEL